ncbi:uncharacterized protein GGS22DRAFT_113709 [Annulohypoxylon maeteangense]|uniref:uncharacterized protein n=1 Tax=Annulohypoxylon maeteangense TaxID=1927788 RepID=UPI002007CFF4|nr:uncharacterized protein GGS22DRAFT_113709 [Annulohypoxylon maeteangense]KAI0879786.1 hypothetical protein GGS22DRAFT_113709 [Annulohypoxylon maeteangense]
MADTPYHPHFQSSLLRSPSPPLSPSSPPSPLPHGGILLGGDPHNTHGTLDTHDTLDTHTRRRSLPFVFPPLFPKNTSSTFLIPSTAEGRPIPLDDSTAAHRTTALRQLSRSQPSSRPRYTGASGPPSVKSTTTETYSQPVVVRTYSGVPPSSSTRGPVSVSTVSSSPNPPPQRPSRDGPVKSMARHKRNEKSRGVAGAKLPPLESFTFKSIIADIQQDVGADLDRIAEICARTRYSLSNQYEVHIAPQGSGSGFLGPPTPSFRNHVSIGPTLQAVSSDDEHMGSMQTKKRRNATRRRSVAYGTLETIMSSSRSSDEDKSNKKPAAEIVEEVRGRATMDNDIKDESASANSTEAQASSEQHDDQRACLPPRSALFAAAIIDTSKSQMQGTSATLKASGAVLLSDPAEPRTSPNHLQTKTSPEGSTVKYYTRDTPPEPSRAVASESVATAAITAPEEPKTLSGLLAGFTAWVSWKGMASELGPLGPSGPKAYSSYAEGTLRELLKSTEPLADARYKGVDPT